MAKKHMKKCLTSLIIREMQTQTIMRQYLISTKMATINKTENKKYWQRCEEIERLVPVGKNVEWGSHCGKQQFLKILKIEVLYDPAILLMGIIPKRIEGIIVKRYLYIHIHCSIIHNI